MNGLDSACFHICRWLWFAGLPPHFPSLCRVCPLQSIPAVTSPSDKMTSVRGSGSVSDSALPTLLCPVRSNSDGGPATRFSGEDEAALFYPLCARCVTGTSVFLLRTACVRVRKPRDSVPAPGNRAGVEMTAELGTLVWSPQSLGSYSTCSWGPGVTLRGAWQSLSASSPAWLGHWWECSAVLTPAVKFQMVLWVPGGGVGGTAVATDLLSHPPRCSWSCSGSVV